MSKREPQPRFWHSAVSTGQNVYVRGGSTPNFDTDEGRQELASKVEEYDSVNKAWRQLTTTGILHPGLSAVACATSGKHLYAYGGYDGSDVCGVLSKLNLETLVWTRLSFEAEGGPMRKDACGIVHFDGERLALIGGYADPSGPIQQGSTFVLNEAMNDGSGWTNEFHVFEISQGSWWSPEIKGTRPPPCADFTLTSIDIHRAVLYGGCRPPEGKRLDKDLYIINLKAMEMSRIEWKPREVWPVVTVGHHAACCLGFNTDHPQLLVSGGRTSQDEPLGGTWLFDFMTKKWKEVKVQGSQLPRWGHAAATVSTSSKPDAVFIFGGTSANYQYGWRRLREENFPRLTETQVITFEYISQHDKTWAPVTSSTEEKPLENESVHIPIPEENCLPSQHDDVISKEACRLKVWMIIVFCFCVIVIILYVISLFYRG